VLSCAQEASIGDEGAEGSSAAPISGAAGELERHAVIDAFLGNRARPHRALCTCNTGGDDEHTAALDASFRVSEEKRLSIGDAQAYPGIPGCLPLVPPYMIRAKAADAPHAETSVA
jgi:choline dehydrogenase-like flavoprotein